MPDDAVTQNAPSAAPANKRKKVEKRSAAHLEDTSNGDEEGPACNSCRKRKTKCSRDQPCSQCTRMNLECNYDESRERSGVKTGVIEALNQRLTMLEHMFLGQGLLFEPLFKQAVGPNSPSAVSVQNRAKALKQYYHAVADSSSPSQSGHDLHPHPVAASASSQSKSTVSGALASSTNGSLLPPLDLLGDLVELYFQNVHPWIPVLHVTSFREKFGDANERKRLTTVLQAITSVCLRFDQLSGLTQEEKTEWSLKCKNAVMLAGMDRFSVVNLQAMVIVSFDIIGSGRGPSSWSIVGSMTRTVEQLQLSVEAEDATSEQNANAFMIRRMKFLQCSSSWLEVEERRRVFWCVFLMDRFCSVATGWNNSLTSADVRRRLPCEGTIWQRGNPVTTPWFGIVDRPVPSQQVLTPSSERQGANDEEVDSIGGFAFCIEATENLNLVTKFFLQQTIKFDDPRNVEMWLLKFKELDLRLVRWRTFLPPKWRNACALNQDGIMDPNLTLAHMTHNTAVIQLHQAVAYPDTQWHDHHAKIPSDFSAETCIAAVGEISLIASQFLAQSNVITNPQFSFCIFIAGRVLLAHARFHSLPLDSTLDDLINSLNEMARRWPGPIKGPGQMPQTLPAQFAKRLEKTKYAILSGERSEGPQTSKSLDIRQAVYSDHFDNSGAEARESEEADADGSHQSPDLQNLYSQQPPFLADPGFYSPDSISLAFPPLPAALENPYSFQVNNAAQPVLASARTPTATTMGHHLPHGQNQLPSASSDCTNDIWNLSGGTGLSQNVCPLFQ